MFTGSEKRRVSSSSFNSPQMLSYDLGGNTPCSVMQKLKVRNGCRLLWNWLPLGAPSVAPPAEGMQGTGTAFQAQVSLKKQATDPMSHTPVQSYANLSGSYSLPAKSDGRHLPSFARPGACLC